MNIWIYEYMNIWRICAYMKNIWIYYIWTTHQESNTCRIEARMYECTCMNILIYEYTNIWTYEEYMHTWRTYEYTKYEQHIKNRTHAEYLNVLLCMGISWYEYMNCEYINISTYEYIHTRICEYISFRDIASVMVICGGSG